MSQPAAPDRARSFAFFVLAVVYFYFAQLVATHSAQGLVSGVWTPLVERIILLFLLLVGYAGMGRAFENQQHPLQAMGLALRSGWQREFGLGAALGWGMLIVTILPLVIFGGLIVTVWANPRQWAILLLDLLILAVASLAEEVVFRGYPFQRLVDSIGPILATLGFSVLFGLAHIFNPSASTTSVIITIFAGWLLSAAYLRTRALWFSWGWHFAWNVSMGIIFGLPISGITRFSPVIQSGTIGPVWMTGGDYGPEASTVAAIVILAGIVAVFLMTGEYARKYAGPAAASSGIPDEAGSFSGLSSPRFEPVSTAPAGSLSGAPGTELADPPEEEDRLGARSEAPAEMKENALSGTGSYTSGAVAEDAGKDSPALSSDRPGEPGDGAPPAPPADFSGLGPEPPNGSPAGDSLKPA